MKPVLFAGGGTGGHLMPALAIGQAMVELDPEVRPYFVGAQRGIEATVLPARPWPFTLLPLEPIYRRRWWRNVRLPLSIARSLAGARRVLAAQRPVLVVGTGGYVAGPVVWAAANRGVPVVLQEQNAYPGYATRRLAGRAKQIHLGFPEARRFLSTSGDVLDTGNPIVPPPLPSARPSRAQAKRKLGFASDHALVLVFGGSQGALAINDGIDQVLAAGRWPLAASLLWQTGAGDYERCRAREQPGRIRVAAFLDPISDAYSAADLVVCRAGAMTLAEVCAWGLPALLVPLPSAAANHQLTNARALSEGGAAALLEQSALSPERIADEVSGLLADPARLADLGSAALRRARPGAAHDIARAALRLV